jgi:hypothetical protein
MKSWFQFYLKILAKQDQKRRGLMGKQTVEQVTNSVGIPLLAGLTPSFFTSLTCLPAGRSLLRYAQALGAVLT